MTNSIRSNHPHDDVDSGFTLIELLIVIVVLAILAGITIFALTGVTGQSAQAACQADAKTVETALQAYDTQNSPTQLAVTGSVTEANAQADLVPTYLHTWPTNTAHYTITIDSTGNVYVMPVSGKNGSDYDTEVSGASATGCYAVS